MDDNNYAIKPSHESAIICSESDGIEEDEEDENLAFIDDHGHNIEDENSIFDHTTFIYHNINSNNGNSNNYKNNSSDNFVDNKKGRNKKSYWLDDNNYAIKPSHESAIICSESDGIEEDEEDENLAFIDDHGHNIEDENSIFDHTTFIYHNINSNNGNSNNYKNNSSDNFVDNKKGKAKADLNYTKNTRSNHATSTIQGTSANNALYEEIRAQERQLLEWITTQI
ncbi:4414_t:CDS:2 [Entrophospora sp. SA101]|nr:4414_t:CDS:2 [Entrophospora sp. SA101]